MTARAAFSREFWRWEPFLSAAIVLGGAASPIWGPLVAAKLRWPRGLAIRAAVAPVGGLVLAGQAHDLLRRRTRLPASTATRLEMTITALFVTIVFVLPLIRRYVRDEYSMGNARNPAARPKR